MYDKGKKRKVRKGISIRNFQRQFSVLYMSLLAHADDKLPLGLERHGRKRRLSEKR